MKKEYRINDFAVVEVESCETLPVGNDMRKVVVELDGRKLTIYTTESNIKAFEFDQQQKHNHKNK